MADGDRQELLARVHALEAQVREQRDIEAIKQLKADYCRAFDLRDWERWGSLLTDDVYLESDAGVLEGREAVLAMMGTVDASVVHNTHSPVIELTGPDTASGTWSNEDWVRLDLGGERLAFHGCGHYFEDYVRTPEGWKVKRSVEKRLRVDPIEGSSDLPVLPD
jgi:ketosteroid isomerase-like protein